jgi:hypothetical protein
MTDRDNRQLMRASRVTGPMRPARRPGRPTSARVGVDAPWGRVALALGAFASGLWGPNVRPGPGRAA